MIDVPVPLGDRSYSVLIGDISVADAAAHIVKAAGKTSGLAILMDAHVAQVQPRCTALVQALKSACPGVPVHIRHLPAGEACKNFVTLAETCEWLADSGFDRKATIIGIGGGACTDHAGFAAAIYQRGVAFILCPTTLLAMVDASVGGKTAVDLGAGKNLVGAFHQPQLVIADLNNLSTLPVREQAAGMAEVIKAGLIADAPLFEQLEARADNVGQLPQSTVADLVAAAVRVKVAVVSEDERESGRRAILNFGHTVGHALESESDFGLLHGEAVALGMIAALQLGIAQGVTEAALLPRTVNLLARFGLPVDLDARVTDAVLDRMTKDKKRSGCAITFVFVPRVGQAVLQSLPIAELKTKLAPSV